jgi:hypothetical protein
MEAAQPKALLAAISIQLGLSATAMAADGTPPAVVVVPVIDATESAEVTIPQPSLILPGEESSSAIPATPASNPRAVTAAANDYRAAASPPPELRIEDQDQHAPGGRWLQIGSNKDPVRGRFRVNRSSAIVGIALGF